MSNPTDRQRVNVAISTNPDLKWSLLWALKRMVVARGIHRFRQIQGERNGYFRRVVGRFHLPGLRGMHALPGEERDDSNHFQCLSTFGFQFKRFQREPALKWGGQPDRLLTPGQANFLWFCHLPAAGQAFSIRPVG